MSIARQAIVDKERSVVAYELFNRSRPSGEHTAASDAQLLFNFLMVAQDDGGLNTYPTLFINCTHTSLASGHLDLVSPQHVVLEIPPLPENSTSSIADLAPTLQKMRQKGFRLAFDHTVLQKSYAPWRELASFIKLDNQAFPISELAQIVHSARNDGPPVQLVAEKVETDAQFRALHALGIDLFQGYWFANPVLVEGQRIHSSQSSILQLINLVRQQASTAEIEEVLKRDPTLSFNLLRFINSASFGMRTEVTSFRHAVMLLGLQKLFKWSALLLTTSHANQSAAAVGSTAVVRGRMMELLLSETEASSDDTDNAFVVGIFSLLDTMLGVPMDTALAQMLLPASITEALLLQTGPLALHLALVVACEQSDEATFSRLCKQLNLTSNQVNWAHLQALAWAESLVA
ncbi:HDOD domain-containing protein [Curvibacter sp. CHRR-16]|nr:HDOD domain-containing protein [Curvibacter sp. CHRR-16]